MGLVQKFDETGFVVHNPKHDFEHKYTIRTDGNHVICAPNSSHTFNKVNFQQKIHFTVS